MLAAKHPNYNGSSYNIMVEWEDGSTTFEPLSVIAADDPVTCAVYAIWGDQKSPCCGSSFWRGLTQFSILVGVTQFSILRCYVRVTLSPRDRSELFCQPIPWRNCWVCPSVMTGSIRITDRTYHSWQTVRPLSYLLPTWIWFTRISIDPHTL